MGRAATTSDVFNAITEPCRREILTVLGTGESPVTHRVERLRLSQPQVSKHLGVLRRVGVVKPPAEAGDCRYPETSVCSVNKLGLDLSVVMPLRFAVSGTGASERRGGRWTGSTYSFAEAR